MSDLKLFWENFVNSERDSYNKSCWLELFIFNYFKQIQDGKSCDTTSFCHPTTISSQLSSELLHTITSLCGKNNECINNLDIRSFEKQKHSNFPQNLQEHNSLTFIDNSPRTDKLIELYQKANEFSNEVPDGGENTNPNLLSENDIKQLSALKECLLGGIAGRILATLHCIGVEDISCGDELASLLVNLFPTAPWHEHKVHHIMQLQLPNLKPQNIDSIITPLLSENDKNVLRKFYKKTYEYFLNDMDEVSDTESVMEVRVEKHISLKVKIDPMDFDYFTSIVRTDDESRFNDPNYSPMRRHKVKKIDSPRTYMTDEFDDFLQYRLGVYEFSEIVANLLSKLCQDNVLKCQIIENSLPIKSLNFAVENLLGLRFDTRIFEDLERLKIKLSLLNLYFSAWNKIPAKFCDSRFFESGSIFFQLLAVLKNAIEQTETNVSSDIYYTLKKDFIYGVLFALLLLLRNFITRKGKQNASLNMHINYLANTENRNIIKYALEILTEDNTCSIRCRGIIDLITKSIVELLKIKNAVLHKNKCKKTKHRRCRYELNHHHYLTDNDRINKDLINNKCNVSHMFLMLANILEIQNYELNLYILKNIYRIRICCCVEPENISKYILSMAMIDERLTNLCFRVIEKLIYKQFDQKCHYCSKFWSEDVLTESNLKSINIYEELLKKESENIFIGTLKHMIRISNIIPNVMSKHLLFEIVFPLFRNKRLIYLTEKNDHNRIITESCLNAVKEFCINKYLLKDILENDILKYLNDLMFIPELTNNCCAILEIVGNQLLFESNVEVYNTECITILSTALNIINPKVLNIVSGYIPKSILYSNNINIENSETIADENSNNQDQSNKQEMVNTLSMAIVIWKSVESVFNKLENCCVIMDSRGIFEAGTHIICGIVSVILHPNHHTKLNLEQDINKYLCCLLEVILNTQISMKPGKIMSSSADRSLQCVRDVVFGKIKTEDDRDDMILHEILESLIKCTNNKNLSKRNKWLPKQNSAFEVSIDYTEDEYHSANEGYEADTEHPNDALYSDDSSTNFPNESLINSLSSFRLNDVKAPLTHLGLYKLIIDILIDVCDGYLGSETQPPTFIIDCIRKLCYFEIDTLLTENLLNGFFNLLQRNEERLEDLQQAILSLIHNLNSRKSLMLYLSLFKCERPPLNILLEPLSSFTIKANEPAMFVTFPKITDSVNPQLFNFSAKIPHLQKKFFKRGFSITLWMKIETTKASVVTDNKNAKSDNTKIIKDAPNQGLHIVSYGLEDCLFEIWIIPAEGLLKYCIKSQNSSTSKISETSILSFPLHNWQHLGINVTPQDNCVEILTFLNFTQHYTKLPYPKKYGSQNEINYTPIFRLGHNYNTSQKNSEGAIKMRTRTWSYHLTNIMIFHSSVLNRHNILDLIGLGPDCTDLTALDMGNIILNPSHVFNNANNNTQILLNNFDVVNNISHHIKKLQEHVCIIYTADRKDAIFFYPENVQTWADVGLPSPPSFRLSFRPLRPYVDQPMMIYNNNKNELILKVSTDTNMPSKDINNLLDDEVLEVTEDINNFSITNQADFEFVESNNSRSSIDSETEVYSTPLKLNRYYQSVDPSFTNGNNQLPKFTSKALLSNSSENDRKYTIADAVLLNGGIGYLLMFFARIVEISESSIEIAHSLQFLLKISHSNIDLYSEFVRLDGLHLIHTVIENEKCKISLYMLKVILDIACSTPVLINQSGSKQFKVLQNTKAVIVYPELIISIIRYYNAWTRKESTESKHILDHLLLVIVSLTRESHIHQEINTAQLTRVNTVQSFLVLCKDMYLNRNAVLDNSSASLMVKILCNLAGSPPNSSIIGEIMQLTLLLHKDRDTYVTHSRSKFYFLLSDITPKKSQKPKIYPNRKTTKKQFAKLKKQKPLGSNTSEPVTSIENLEFNNDQINNDSKIQLDNDLQIVKKYETRNVQNDYYRKNPRSQNQPIDAKKLNKALTNLQIKQNGKKDKRYGKKKHGRNRLSSESMQRPAAADNSGGSEVTEIDSQIINTDEYVIIESTDILNLEEKHNAESKEKDENGKSTFFFNREESFDLYSASVADTSRASNKHLDGAPEINNWTISLLEGLILLVKDLILVIPDSNVNQTFEMHVRPEPLLVMANTANASVRAAIIKLLTAYISRASASELDRLVKLQYWYMLANQISSYQADDTLINSVAALLTGSHLPIEEQLDLPPPIAIPSFTLPVIVSVLYTTLNDTALCHNYICFLRHIFNVYPNCNQNLLSYFLIETLLRCLLQVTKSAPSSTDVSGFNETDIIIQDIHIFLVTIMNKVIMMNAPQYTVIISDMLNQFIFLENNFKKTDYTVRVLRETRAAVLRGLIDILEDKIKGHSGLGLKSTSSYIATVLSTSFNNVNSKSKSLDLGLSKNEINIRFNQVFKWAIEFIVLNEPKYNPGETEINLFQRLLQVILQGYSDSRDRCSLSCDLISWSLNPIRTSAVIIHTMHGLMQLSNTKDFIRKLGMYTEGFVTEIQQFSLHIYQLRNTTLSSLEQSICEQFVTVLGITDTTHAYNNLTVTDMIEWSEKVRGLKIEEASETINRSVHKYESLCKSLIEKAMSLTREVNGEQSDIRGKHIGLIRFRHQGGSYQHLLDRNEDNYSQNSQSGIVKWWDYLIDTFTNERAQWHFPKSYPRSWEIDPTECPGRMRVRLRRTKLNIQERFLMEGHRDKLESLSQPLPFKYLQQTNTNCLSGQRAQYSAPCNIIELSGEISAEIVIGYAIYLIPDQSERKAICCEFSDIIEICPRRYQLSNIGVEIFLVTGRTVLISLISEADRDQLLKVLDDCEMINRTQTETFNQILQKWKDREITNYEYLIALNKISGRSYNDLMQYPVFPWILADYENDILNLNDPKSYRKLKKPIAIQHKEAEQHYINNYNYLKVTMVDSPFKVHREPYHYASHYSNSGTVLHFLVRLPPYTSLFLNYQDNNFDLPDRTFHSINTTWKLASKDSTTDVKELIPEFYYLSEFLLNNEGFLFGTRQSGMQVNDVNLPSWCDNARTFTLVHRQALEHPFVTENLPKWLDLIYGYKQTGKNAVDAINLFHPSTYFGSNLQQTTDPVELQAWSTMVKTYGQTPIQLLKNPHPSAHNNHQIHLQPPVISSVQGLRWGNYAGSPANADPMIVLTRQFKDPLRRLVTIPSNEVIALSERCCVLSMKGLTLPILSCGHNDNVAKIHFKKEFTSQSVFTFSKLDPITYCSTAPDFHQIWLGHQSGLITVHQYNIHQNISSYSKHDSNSPLLVKKNPVNVSQKASLVGHENSVTSICISPGFKIAATGSLDGTAIIWDLNEISYVRSIRPVSDIGPIKLVTISPTLGDIVTIHISNNPNSPVDISTPVTPDPESFGPDILKKVDYCKSILQLNTINARKVSEISINEEVTSICYSSAPEGISVNVIVAGFATGIIRLFSSWDLKLLRQIQCGYIPSPVISIAYSQDCQHLFASTEDGHFFVWENPNGRPSPPKFQNLTYL